MEAQGLLDTRVIASPGVFDKELSKENPEYGVEEVLQWVKPQGLCAGLVPIKVGERPFSEDSKRPRDDLEPKDRIKLKETTKPILALFQTLFSGQDLYKRALLKVVGEDFTENDIGELLNSSDPRVQKRALEIINHGIDPDLLPFAFRSLQKRTSQRSPIPDSLVDALAVSQEARDLLAGALVARRSTVIEESVKNKFAELLTGAYENLKPDDTDGLGAIKDFVEYSFFYKDNRYLDELFPRVLETTSDAYFQDLPYQSEWLFRRSTSYEADTKARIVEFAKSLEIGRFLISVHRNVDRIFRDYFPDLYIPGAVTKLSLDTDKKESKENLDLSQNTDLLDDGNAWYDGAGGVGLRTVRPPQSNTAALIAQESEKIFPGMPKEGKRSIVYTIILMHEEAHAMYGNLVLGQEMQAAVNMGRYDKTADHALNEGTAVLLESLAIDLLVENPGLLNLDSSDIETLKDHKLARYQYLKDRQNGYTEGMHRILHRIYGQAIGPVGDRDKRRGLRAVREFLDNVDPKKTLTISRDSPEYQENLKSGDPKKWRELFSK